MPLVNTRPATEFRTRGPFDNSINYDTDDRVSHNGMSYVAPEPIPMGEGAPNPGVNRWINDPGSEGEMGNKGIKGDSVRAVYIRSAAMPTDPTGTWNGRTLTLTGGWSEIIPSGTDTLYRSDATLDNTANTATFTTPEQWRGPVGPEPSDTRLNTLISTALTAAITAGNIQSAAEVLQAIANYLSTNGYIAQPRIQDLINATLTSIIATDGLIQVQYTTDQVDWETVRPTSYRYIRIRGSNPNAPWFEIDLGIVSGGGGGGTNLPQATNTEIDAATETDPRSYAPDQLPELVRRHETYPWTHSIRARYGTGSAGIKTFRFQDESNTRYLDVSQCSGHDLLYFQELERHDEFAIVAEATKDEIYRGEIDADFDETATRIAVLDIPDTTPNLVNGTHYLLEFTRSVPDIGLTQRETEDTGLGLIEDWARAKVRNTFNGQLEDYVSDTAIPLDRRYENLPIVWQREDTQVEWYDPATITQASTDLQIKILTLSGEKYIQVQSTSTADIGFLSGLKKFDFVAIYNSTGNFSAFFIAKADWDVTNGLQVTEVWNVLDISEDYENLGTYVTLRHTRAEAGSGAIDTLSVQFSTDNVAYTNTAPTDYTYIRIKTTSDPSYYVINLNEAGIRTGAARTTWRGAYDANTTYMRGDLAWYQDTAFPINFSGVVISRQDNNVGNTPIITRTPYWDTLSGNAVTQIIKFFAREERLPSTGAVYELLPGTTRGEDGIIQANNLSRWYDSPQLIPDNRSHLTLWSVLVHSKNNAQAVVVEDAEPFVDPEQGALDKADVEASFPILPLNTPPHFPDFAYYSFSRAATGAENVNLVDLSFFAPDGTALEENTLFRSNALGRLDLNEIGARCSQLRSANSVSGRVSVRVTGRYAQIIGTLSHSPTKMTVSGTGYIEIAFSQTYNHVQWSAIAPNGEPLGRSVGTVTLTESNAPSTTTHAYVITARVEPQLGATPQLAFGDQNDFPAVFAEDASGIRFASTGFDFPSPRGTWSQLVDINDFFITGWLQHTVGSTAYYQFFGNETLSEEGINRVPHSANAINVQASSVDLGDVFWTDTLSTAALANFAGDVIGNRFGSGLYGLLHKKSTVLRTDNITGLDAEYSIDGQTNWHDMVMPTDEYIRFSVDSGLNWWIASRSAGSGGGTTSMITEIKTYFSRSAAQPSTPAYTTTGTVGTDAILSPRTSNHWYASLAAADAADANNPNLPSWTIQVISVDFATSIFESSPIRGNVARASSAELTAATETAVREFSVADIRVVAENFGSTTPGARGLQGRSVLPVYLESATTPANPTGTWNGTTLTLTGGWSIMAPASPTNRIYTSLAVTDDVNNTVTFGTVVQWTGADGAQGLRGFPAVAREASGAYEDTTSQVATNEIAVRQLNNFERGTLYLGDDTGIDQGYVRQVPNNSLLLIRTTNYSKWQIGRITSEADETQFTGVFYFEFTILAHHGGAFADGDGTIHVGFSHFLDQSEVVEWATGETTLENHLTQFDDELWVANTDDDGSGGDPETNSNFDSFYSAGMQSSNIGALSNSLFRIEFPHDLTQWDGGDWVITFGNNAAWAFDPVTGIFTYYGSASSLIFEARTDTGTVYIGRGADGAASQIGFNNVRLQYRLRNDNNNRAWGSWHTIYNDPTQHFIGENTRRLNISPQRSTTFEIDLNQDVANNGHDELEFRWEVDAFNSAHRQYLLIRPNGFTANAVLNAAQVGRFRLFIDVTTGFLSTRLPNNDVIALMSITEPLSDRIKAVDHIRTRVFSRGTTAPTSPIGGTWNGNVFAPLAPWSLGIPIGTDPLWTAEVELRADLAIAYGVVYPLSDKEITTFVLGDNYLENFYVFHDGKLYRVKQNVTGATMEPFADTDNYEPVGAPYLSSGKENITNVKARVQWGSTGNVQFPLEFTLPTKYFRYDDTTGESICLVDSAEITVAALGPGGQNNRALRWRNTTAGAQDLNNMDLKYQIDTEAPVTFGTDDEGDVVVPGNGLSPNRHILAAETPFTVTKDQRFKFFATANILNTNGNVVYNYADSFFSDAFRLDLTATLTPEEPQELRYNSDTSLDQFNPHNGVSTKVINAQDEIALRSGHAGSTRQTGVDVSTISTTPDDEDLRDNQPILRIPHNNDIFTVVGYNNGKLVLRFNPDVGTMHFAYTDNDDIELRYYNNTTTAHSNLQASYLLQKNSDLATVLLQWAQENVPGKAANDDPAHTTNPREPQSGYTGTISLVRNDLVTLEYHVAGVTLTDDLYIYDLNGRFNFTIDFTRNEGHSVGYNDRGEWTAQNQESPNPVVILNPENRIVPGALYAETVPPVHSVYVSPGANNAQGRWVNKVFTGDIFAESNTLEITPTSAADVPINNANFSLDSDVINRLKVLNFRVNGGIIQTPPWFSDNEIFTGYALLAFVNDVIQDTVYLNLSPQRIATFQNVMPERHGERHILRLEDDDTSTDHVIVNYGKSFTENFNAIYISLGSTTIPNDTVIKIAFTS